MSFKDKNPSVTVIRLLFYLKLIFDRFTKFKQHLHYFFMNLQILSWF